MNDKYIISLQLERYGEVKGEKIIYSMCQLEACNYDNAKEKAFNYYSEKARYDYIKILSCERMININEVA